MFTVFTTHVLVELLIRRMVISVMEALVAHRTFRAIMADSDIRTVPMISRVGMMCCVLGELLICCVESTAAECFEADQTHSHIRMVAHVLREFPVCRVVTTTAKCLVTDWTFHPFHHGS